MKLINDYELGGKMSFQDFRELLEQSDNKVDILTNVEILKKYNILLLDLLAVIRDYLSDEEKLKLFDSPLYAQLIGTLKVEIIDSISNEEIAGQLFNNPNFTNKLQSYQICLILEKLSDNTKIQVLKNEAFLSKHSLSVFQLSNIVSTLSPESKSEFLMDVDYIKNHLHLDEFQVTNLVKELQSDKEKSDFIQLYQLEKYQKIDILKTCSDSYKLSTIFEDASLDKRSIIDLLQTFNVDALNDFLLEHKEFCGKKDISPYEIICKFDAEKQKAFLSSFEDINLTLQEKREILATLKADVKQGIDTSNFPEEYKSAISIQATEYGHISEIDFERDFHDYQGLDKLISVNPEQFTADQKKKFIEICTICPNLEVINLLNGSVGFGSTGAEYIVGEKWIDSVIDNINPNYSKAQKLAIIDNAIGKMASYSPDFGTEVFDVSDSRALWKIIASGYGVCNGLANLEKYMLARVGIDSEVISSGSHAFLKIKDIELPFADGSVQRGDTIVDATWNLMNHRFGSFPNNFCISYEQARKNDIDLEGRDHNSHKNDKELQDVTLGLDEQSLRQLFSSVGIADKDGEFPVKNLIEKSKKIHEIYADHPAKNISAQFSLLQQTCPEFATCQNSSMAIISDILLSDDNLHFKKCVVNRVFDRNDEDKRPVLYVYIDSAALGKRFYYADKSRGEFQELPQEEFVNRFECYDFDLEDQGREQAMGNK